MIDTDYKITALGILLDESCLSERYYPLIAPKDALIAGLSTLGCQRKSEAEKLTDADFLKIGLADTGLVRLFRRFLTIYDPSPQKFREIPKVTSDPNEEKAFYELYALPGVKAVRASLYFASGYRSLKDFAEADVGEILGKTAETIAAEGLSCITPLPKEVRTHIAVAKAFLM